MRAAAAESGAPLNTISRVERGQMPDLMNFKRLAEWIGLDTAQFFAPSRRRQESTPEAIGYLLRHDPNLDDAAAARIAGIVESLYRVLVKPPDGGVVAHLHAADTLVPSAAVQLGAMLNTMGERLTNDPDCGSSPDW